MWYYLWNQKRIGPVSDSAMIALIRNGTIIRQTLVWKEGMADWQPVGQGELAGEFLTIPPMAPASYPSIAYSNPLTTFPPGSLRALWLWFAWLVGAGYPLMIFCIGIPAAIAGVTILYILLYRLWSVIQDGKVRTSPGKAVGFCFIPFFNLFWMYMAFVGLSQDLNLYCDERLIAGPRVSRGLALSMYIFWIVSLVTYIGIWPEGPDGRPLAVDIIFGVGLLLSLTAMILLIILMKQCVNVAMRIMEFRGS